MRYTGCPGNLCQVAISKRQKRRNFYSWTERSDFERSIFPSSERKEIRIRNDILTEFKNDQRQATVKERKEKDRKKEIARTRIYVNENTFADATAPRA